MRSSIAMLAMGAALAGPVLAETPSPGTKIINYVTGAAEKTLATPLTAQKFSWTNGPPTTLPATSTHICLLSGFAGKLAGAGELGKLYIDFGAPGGPRYMLGGTTGQGQFRVMAHCASRNQFVWGSDRNVQPKITSLVQASGCMETGKLMKDATGAPFLAAFGGRFAGRGEKVAVQRASTGIQGRINACSGTITMGGIGYDDGKPILYRNPTSRSVTPTTYAFGVGNNYKDTFAFSLFGDKQNFQDGKPAVVPFDEAFCGLTGLTGKFNGYGERVQIEQMGKYWWISTTFGAGANEPYVGAAVRCLSRDQRPV